MHFAHLLYIVILLPILSGALGYFLPTRAYHRLLACASLLTSALAAVIFARVRFDGDISYLVAGWPAGIAIRLAADVYSAPLALLAAVFFSAVFLFNTRSHDMDRTFMFLFVALESALLGIFLSGDLFNIYVLIELGMLIIAILIMYKQDRQSVYDAMLYLMLNFIAMAFMLLGIGYVYRITGVLDLALLAERIALIEEPRAVILPYALIMTAVALKAAMFPLFSWLPRAHGAPSAPAVVSAVLSGVQVKAGVYLLVRLSQVFGPLIDASAFFRTLGFVTAVIGFLLAVAQKDLKLILAYSTISQMGLIVLGLHLGTETAFWGGMYHIINHALFKGLLFLTAGTIIEAYGTRICSDIRGVFRAMPLIGVATLAGMLGITGAPFFNGSISKYFIQEGLQGDLGGLAMFVTNLGTTLVFVKVAAILFGTSNTPVRVEKDPWIAGVSLLFGLACLAGGLFGGPTVALLFGIRLEVAGALSAQKLMGFALTLALAFLAYRLILRRMAPYLSTVYVHKFSFNQLTVMMTLFFMGLLTWLWLYT